MESLIIAVLSRKRPPAALGYAVALGMVLALRALQLLYRPLPHRYMVFLPLVFVAALLFGRKAGVFATLLSAVAVDGLFLAGSGSSPVWPGIFFLVVFLALGVAMSVVIEALHEAVCKLLDKEAETALLLDELTHRSRNDLMMIASVLGLQARRQRDPEARAALESAVSRVRVITQAQDRLRTSGKRGCVELATYLQAMGHGLGDLMRDVRPIAVRVHAAPMMVQASVAISVGLIANELVTNAFKYAFPGERGGTVTISLDLGDDGAVVLVVEDDGVGLPPSQMEGLGSRLVRLLASHLGGTVEREPVPRGHRVRVSLPIEHDHPEAAGNRV
ncbi:MAG TPA: histidine kinase dimerization/phosphoacceptor domain -containing protein [Frateuria sp.]|uniref:sensor histidine kinase n=1 Tax=Frateuria sp. TaxID=2211372 RepID=UPI002DE3EE7F|nr:histidine kinase dimerization/phosphoacceptor domain -containing protein [Frateuria sp.]